MHKVGKEQRTPIDPKGENSFMKIEENGAESKKYFNQGGTQNKASSKLQIKRIWNKKPGYLRKEQLQIDELKKMALFNSFMKQPVAANQTNQHKRNTSLNQRHNEANNFFFWHNKDSTPN